jgi:hypothetical protein
VIAPAGFIGRRTYASAKPRKTYAARRSPHGAAGQHGPLGDGAALRASARAT